MNALRAAPFVLALILSGCDGALQPDSEEANAPPPPANVIDASNLNEIMLTVADPNQAVEYFRSSLAQQPDRLEFKRGYAQSLSRAGKHAEATLVYRQLVADGVATTEDRIGYAESLGNANAWEEAEAQLALIPDIPSSYRLSLLRAMAADQKADWAGADRYYEAARRLTPRPARVLNNWGVSRMSRGDLTGAETVLQEAISFDPKLFSAKNNLVIARGLQEKFSLPVIPMTDEEKAQLLHNLAVIALRKGRNEVGRGLLEQAVATHPRYFEAASQKLAALGSPLKR